MGVAMGSLFGPRWDQRGVEFRLWAPSADAVEVIFKDGDAAPLEKNSEGFWCGHVPSTAEGTLYKFRIGELEVPDPASRRQVDGTAGWSVVCAPLDLPISSRPLRPWHETILCEVHVGTASPEGTFAGLAARLEHFRDAGYTALEVMPINTFPGERGWGYDGTLIFAPHAAYGSRKDLRALVDRAHDLGLSLILDVVYNHFGEVDNFFDDYAPEWFDQTIQSPWGPGIDFTRETVRHFFYENAAMWLGEFNFDGLRFDAIHEMKTECRGAFLTGLAKTCRAIKPHAKLIVENMDNIASWLDRDCADRPEKFTAQWNDDIHHVLDYLVTGESRNGYGDGSSDAIADLEKGLADGFVHDGEADGDSDGRTRDEPASRLSPAAFVSYVQNHDQIGNRGDSQRLPDRVSAEKLDFLHFTMMLAPQIPLFFMGEEAHLRSPFPFFIDFPEKEAEAKRRDRERQMREIFKEDTGEDGLPDPNDRATFLSAKIDWDAFSTEQSQAALARFKTLAAWRETHLWPLASTTCLDATTTRKGNAIRVSWIYEAGTQTMALNPSDEASELPWPIPEDVLCTGSFERRPDGIRFGPWSAVAFNEPTKR